MSSPFNIFIKPLKINEVNNIMGLLPSRFKGFFQKKFHLVKFGYACQVTGYTLYLPTTTMSNFLFYLIPACTKKKQYKLLMRLLLINHLIS